MRTEKFRGILLSTLLVISLMVPLSILALTPAAEALSKAPDLFISEYIEGGSYNKALEIANYICSPVDLSDYQIELYSNGSATITSSQVLSGTLNSGDVYVICHPSAHDNVLAIADQTSTTCNWNGDDGIVLRKISDGSVVDAIGQYNVDPGSTPPGWPGGGTDQTQVRKDTILQGDTNFNDAFTFATEWDTYSKDTFDYLGWHYAKGTWFEKCCMPDLGQHCQNWCWVAAAANSMYWWSQHGYPELIDDPENVVFPDNNYITQMIPHPPPPVAPPCFVYRLLHEIATDCLWPQWPESEIGIENTWCTGIFDDQYFFGLQEFIDEQGAKLIVHEIVDNNVVWMPPPQMDNIVIYRPPTLEDYQRELERCQDVLLWLNFRHEYPYEDTDHVVTGVGFSYDNTWIIVSDPWTAGAPDHGNDLHHAPENEPYENLAVLSEENEPLWVLYEGFPVQVSKMVYISPIEECGVEVTIDPWYQDGTPCENLYYDVTVHNTGTVVDDFTLSYIPDGWPDIWIEPGVLEDIAPCENKVATLIVHVPEWAEHCTEKEIVVIAESKFCGATDNDTAWAHVVVPPTCGVEVTIEPKHKRGTPCTWLEFVVSVHNTGNIVDNYLVWVEPDGWPMENIILEYDVLVNVLPSETRTTFLYVHIPDDALPCTHKEIVVVAESEFCGATDNDNALVQVVSKWLHNIEPGYPLDPDNWVCWTIWHEIYPTYSQYYHLSSWEDTNLDLVVSPGDQIDITNLDNENDITWYYVKDVTITLALEIEELSPPESWWYLEFEDGWENYWRPIYDPVGTQWNEIYPVFCNRYLLVDWSDTNMNGELDFCDWVLLVDKVTWEPLPFWLHVANVATDLVLCEIVEPWTGLVDISLLNLYTVNVEKILDLNLGSKLVVKFYAYDNVTFESENVIETFSPPWHVEENENARHPGGIGTKIARLDLTTNDTGNVIATIASFTVTRDDLFGRIMEIKGLWPIADDNERNALFSEIMDIKGQWPIAPS